MTVLLSPAGPFGQAASLCFLLCAVWGDVLLIRLFLFAAYCFLLFGAATGYPRWGSSFTLSSGVSVDGLIWAGACLLLHGFALGRLLLDERPIKFRSEDEEQLWRFFYRRGGMQRLEMQEVLRYGGWRRVPAGQRILGPGESRVQLCLLVEGLAEFRAGIFGENAQGAWKPLNSGALFDKRILNVFGVYIGLDDNEKQLEAVACTDCLLYSWSMEELNTIATQCAPAVGSFWRNVALCSLGLELDWRENEGAVLLCATGEPETPAILKGGRSRDFTDPLRSFEQPRRTLRTLLAWLRRSLSPLLPRGMRHNALPIHGILARNRVVAMKGAEASLAAMGMEPSQVAKAGRPSAEQEVDAGPVQHGGWEAMRILKQLQSMRQLEATDAAQLARALSDDSEISAGLAGAASPRWGRAQQQQQQQEQQGQQSEHGQQQSVFVTHQEVELRVRDLSCHGGSVYFSLAAQCDATGGGAAAQGGGGSGGSSDGAGSGAGTRVG